MVTFSRRYLLAALALGALLQSSACGDDETPAQNDSGQRDVAAADGGADTARTDTAAGDTAAGDAAAGDTAVADATPPSDTGIGDTATGDGAAPAPEFAALVRGTLYTTDLAEAKTTHDGVAAGGQATVQGLGDFAHDVLLGTTLLGTTANEFLAIDRWTNSAGMAIYEDPGFLAAFGTLFALPPNLEKFERKKDWHEWGDLDAVPVGTAHWFIVVRGTLAAADIETAKATHDLVASGGEAQVKAVGDVAHVVHLGLADWHEFFAVDVWTSDAAIEAVYTDPDFQAAFAVLFSSAPTVHAYASTDWYQW